MIEDPALRNHSPTGASPARGFLEKGTRVLDANRDSTVAISAAIRAFRPRSQLVGVQGANHIHASGILIQRADFFRSSRATVLLAPQALDDVRIRFAPLAK
ncbi:MAG: hypothetical protein ABI680_14900 [Chthoniobacteraceae bacterium]